MPTAEERLKELGVTLITEFPVYRADARTFVRSGNMLYLSGQTSRGADGQSLRGKVGDNLTVEEGYQGARGSAIALMSVVKVALGDLEKVRRWVKVLGMVNTTPDFIDTSGVVNGASDLICEVFGERGPHARSAVGMASIPGGSACEIDI